MIFKPFIRLDLPAMHLIKKPGECGIKNPNQRRVEKMGQQLMKVMYNNGDGQKIVLIKALDLSCPK
jgi:hypothetical protein